MKLTIQKQDAEIARLNALVEHYKGCCDRAWRKLEALEADL